MNKANPSEKQQPKKGSDGEEKRSKATPKPNNHKKPQNEPVKAEKPVEDVADRTSEALNTSSASQMNLGNRLRLQFGDAPLPDR